MSSPTADVLGEIGLPVPIRELASKTWDVIVVGAGTTVWPARPTWLVPGSAYC